MQIFFLLAILVASVLGDLATIEAVGNKFFNSSSGEQFFIKGLAYQRSRQDGDNLEAYAPHGYVDSLAHPDLCLRDVELLSELGVNAVRVYQIDPREDHDVCMHVMAKHGIYVMVDVLEPTHAINREHPRWDHELFRHFTAVVDSMHRYDNVLGFVVGNGVVTGPSDSGAAPFVKAAIRDIKAHIAHRQYRPIPVGYTANDDTATRRTMAEYLECTEHSGRREAADFVGVALFAWCGDANYDSSGYRERTVEMGDAGVPVFLSEYGCNTKGPRRFSEIGAIYGPAMSRVWSGGFVFELFQHVSGHGLVEEREGRFVKLDDFHAVRLRLLEAAPRGAHRGYAADRIVDRPCPAMGAQWRASPKMPPSPANTSACDAMMDQLTCVALTGDGDVLDRICAESDCGALAQNGTSGVYGDYSGCSARARVSWALNEHYMATGDPDTCASGGGHLTPVHQAEVPLALLVASPVTSAEPTMLSISLVSLAIYPGLSFYMACLVAVLYTI